MVASWTMNNAKTVRKSLLAVKYTQALRKRQASLDFLSSAHTSLFKMSVLSLYIKYSDGL